MAARWMRWLGATLGIGLSLGIGVGSGCATGGSTRGAGGAGGEGGSGNGPGPGSGPGAGGSDFDAGIQEGGLDPDAACAKFTVEAQQAPAAMLIVLDGSASMNKQSKWGTAQLAVVSAVDKDVFDTMSLGLTVFPSAFSDPPQCLCDAIGVPDIQQCKQFFPILTGGPGVSCGVPILPQVPMAAAGKDKTNAATGVRRQIYDWLVGHNPLSNGDDGSPIYDALQAGYETLKAYPVERRILTLITDGGFSCTSVASPARAGYQDANGCPDWEQPPSVNKLIGAARTDATKPINTFVVGVPGSNSTGQKVDGFDTPPYNMQLALSTYAVSGSPDTIDPACSKDAQFDPSGGAPAKPCHIDLSSAGFNADALAKAIADIRGKALGCVYDLPQPGPGQTIDPGQVNVNLSIDGAVKGLAKRSDPADTCAGEGCWDYTADGKVEILGGACTSLNAAQSVKVDILVGCATILK